MRSPALSPLSRRGVAKREEPGANAGSPSKEFKDPAGCRSLFVSPHSNKRNVVRQSYRAPTSYLENDLQLSGERPPANFHSSEDGCRRRRRILPSATVARLIRFVTYDTMVEFLFYRNRRWLCRAS